MFVTYKIIKMLSIFSDLFSAASQLSGELQIGSKLREVKFKPLTEVSMRQRNVKCTSVHARDSARCNK